MRAIIEGRSHPTVHYGTNGVFGEIAEGEPVTVTTDLETALEAAGFEVEPEYLPDTGSATGRITLLNASGNTTRRPISVNGVVSYLTFNTPFEPTDAEMEAITNAGIEYEIEYDSLALAALTLDNDTIADDAVAEDPVGDVVGATAGSTLELTDDAGGLFALVDGTIEVVDTVTADDYDIEITETLDGYVGSPKASTITITVEVAP